MQCSRASILLLSKKKSKVNIKFQKIKIISSSAGIFFLVFGILLNIVASLFPAFILDVVNYFFYVPYSDTTLLHKLFYNYSAVVSC